MPVEAVGSNNWAVAASRSAQRRAAGRQRSARAVPPADLLASRPPRLPRLPRRRAACSPAARCSASATTARWPGAARPAFATPTTSTASTACPTTRRATAPSTAAAPSPGTAKSCPRASAAASCSSGSRASTASSTPAGATTTASTSRVRAVPSDLAHYFEGYLALAEAQTVDAHRRALALINDGPFDFNHVYGAPRRRASAGSSSAALPRRRREGLFVRDAHDPDAQWDGWVPFDVMPKSLDPPRGFVATANSMTDPDSCAIAFTATHCEPRYRTDADRVGARRHRAAHAPTRSRRCSATWSPTTRRRCATRSADAIGAIAGNDVARARPGAAARRGTAPSRATPAGALLFALLQQDLPRRLFVPLLGPQLGAPLRQRPARHAAPAPAAARSRRSAARRHRARRAPVGRRAGARVVLRRRQPRRRRAGLRRRSAGAGVRCSASGSAPSLSLLPGIGAALRRPRGRVSGRRVHRQPVTRRPRARPQLRHRRRHQPLHLRSRARRTKRCSPTPPVRAPIRTARSSPTCRRPGTASSTSARRCGSRTTCRTRSSA